MSTGPELQRAPPICESASPRDVAGIRRAETKGTVRCDTAGTGVMLGNHSLLGFLCSTIAHSLLLLALGLIAATVPDDNPLMLHLFTADTSAAPALEILETIQLDPSPSEMHQANQADASAPALELLVAEPTLFEEARFFELQRTGRAAGNTHGGGSGQQSDIAGTFFGTRAFGNAFVYVVDRSFSMGYPSEYGETRFQVACRELLRSINQLKPTQSFCVFMFCYRTQVMFNEPPIMLPATLTNKQRLADWVDRLELGPGTDPRYGTMMALRLNPDAIFLLSDGEFNGRDRNAHRIRRNVPIEVLIDADRKSSIPIHTIAFEDIQNRKRLRRISTTTGGTHRFVGRISSAELVIDDLRSLRTDDLLHGLQGLVDGTRRIHDDQFLQLVTKLITKKLSADEPAIRQRAHQALRVLADGADMGPDDHQAPLKDYVAAEKQWKRYWARRFREHHASGRRLDKRLE